MNVSVVIPCFNSAAFLRETVASVMAQTRPALELILVDDESTDDTPVVIEHLLSQANGSIRAVHQTNAGVAAARNHGISLARAEYILPVDADDLIAPTMLEECAQVLDTNPQVALVYTDRQDFGDLERIWAAGRYELGRLKYHNQIAYCSMFRRAMWQAIGGYRTNVSGFDDWDFWLAAAARGFRGHHLPKPLLQHRRRRSSQLWTILDRYKRFHAQIILNNREVYSEAEVAVAERYLTTGQAGTLLTACEFTFMHQHRLDSMQPRAKS